MNIFLYTLSKILPNIFLPLGLSLIILIRNIKNKKKDFSILVIFILYLFSIKITSQTLINFVEYPGIFKEINKLSSADAIVVLSGGGVNDAKYSEEIFKWKNAKRYLAGIELYKSNKSDILLFTGGDDPFSSSRLTEGEIYKNSAIEMGLDPKNIIVTKAVSNTYEESIEVKNELIQYKNSTKIPKIILITSAYHMPRAKLIFKRQNIEVESFPVDFQSSFLSKKEIIMNPISWVPNAGDLYISSFSIREIMGRIYYRYLHR